MVLASLCLVLVACGAGSLRWLRVGQREHYLPGTVSTFGLRWWRCSAGNMVLGLAGIAGAVASVWVPPASLVAAAVAAGAPLGLGLRGRTSKLAPTARLRRLAAFFAGAVAVVVSAGAALHGMRGALSAAALAAMGAPLLADFALFIAKPLEARLLAPFVREASRRLGSVSPRVVAITGSYGKTTTKGYVAHLVSGSLSAVATPASFNNTAGLARAINEHLSAGTQVFVAEMGTYGRGEIESMCSWVVPEVSVITAIGPVHLERMGSLENIAQAKAEILDRARVAVLNIDYPLLDALAQKAEAAGKTVWRCSSVLPTGATAGGPGRQRAQEADVHAYWESGPLGGPKMRVRAFTGAPITGAPVPRGSSAGGSSAGEPGPRTPGSGEAALDVSVEAAPEVEPGNVACAVAVALSLGVPMQVVERRLGSLPGAPHRRVPQTGARGTLVIDDTYNSNPAGARAALALLAAVGTAGGKRVVVTPGMVELGKEQDRENARFAAAAGEVATELIVVGRTNAASLLRGARGIGLKARRVAHRQDAVSWVSENLGPGDVVLYENDLPDHYP